MVREAQSLGADIIVSPELALPTFFLRGYIDDVAELHSYCEREMPSAESLPLSCSHQSGAGFSKCRAGAYRMFDGGSARNAALC